jgi:hypothetical protein
MSPEEINRLAINVVAFLHEGDEKNALEIFLQTSGIEFIEAHEYNDDNYNGHEPDTFFLHGSRKLYEAFKDGADESKQIISAFEASNPKYHLVKARYKSVTGSIPPWREQLSKELPAIGALDAEVID